MFKLNDKLYLLIDGDKIAVTVISKTLSLNAKKARVEDTLGCKFWAEVRNLIRPEEWLAAQPKQQPLQQEPKQQIDKQSAAIAQSQPTIDFANPAKFAEALKLLVQPEAIKELCDRLADFLFGDREYAANTRCAKLGKYSKLIKELDCLAEGKNAFYQTKQDGSNWLRHLYFKYTGIADTDWSAINTAAAQKVASNLGNQIAGLEVDRYEQSVSRLLQSSNIWEIGAGLIAASGRRPIEIIEVGTFEIEGDGLLFGGQAKKRGEQSEPYSIPLIGCTPDLFVEKLAAFRTSYEVQRFRQQFTIDGEIDLKKLSDPITKQICRRGIVPGLAWIPTNEGKSAATASDLRAAWVTVVEEKFKPSGKYSLLFRAEVLGHRLDVGSMPTLNYSRYAEPTEIAEPAIEPIEEIAPIIEELVPVVAAAIEPAHQFAIGEQVSIASSDRSGTIAEIRDAEYLVIGEDFEQWVRRCDLQSVGAGDRTHTITAISLHQPWASLIACGQKTYETRSWSTKYRGPIAIHAAKKVPGNLLGLPCTRESVPLGAVIAIADLVDCIEMDVAFIEAQSDLERSVGDWQVGRFAWQLVNVRPIVPVAAKGKQGLFKWEMPRVLELMDSSAVIPVLAGAIGLIEIEKEKICLEPSNSSQELAESDSALTIESGTHAGLAADGTHTAHKSENLVDLGGRALYENFEKFCPNESVSASAPEKNTDPTVQKSRTSVNGRHDLDFYETPAWMSLLILKYAPIAGIIGEVCSGHGAIARILKMAGHQIWTNDTDTDKPADYHFDAASPLLWGNFPTAEWIVTNPPYGNLSAPIVRAAYAHAKRGIVMLLRQDWDEGCGDRIGFLKNHPPTTKIIVPRYCFRRGKNGAWATDDDPTCIYIWDKKITNKLTRCIWLEAKEIPLWHRTPDSAPSGSAIAKEVAKYQVVSERKEVVLDAKRQEIIDRFLAYNEKLPFADRWRISNLIVQQLLACSDKLASDWNAQNASLLIKLNNGMGHTHNRGRKFDRAHILKQLGIANV